MHEPEWSYLKKISFDVGEDLWWVMASVEGSTDPTYGADTDGHRGMPMDFVEDVKPIYLIKDDEDKIIQLDDAPDDVKDAMEEAIQKAIDEDDLENELD